MDLEDRSADPRLQLVERISATEPFRKSPRFRDLLRYLAERTINGSNPEELTERAIGQAVFGKPADYSPTEDSTVRVHVRQLRLKLHEYFDTAGREETIILEVPKGGFMPVFQEVRPSAQVASQAKDHAFLESTSELQSSANDGLFALSCAPLLSSPLDARSCSIGWSPFRR